MLDPAAAVLGRVAEVVVSDRRARGVLQGDWLGHPAHPLLTDLPIGFWTSASVLDVLGGRRARPAATALTGLGVLSAGSALASGLAEFPTLDRRGRRAAVVHAVSNLTATALYARSWAARRHGDHRLGVVLAGFGAGVATVGGYLGGHLVFGASDGTGG
ncbi:MAG: DUF2231 domain-containing protein [Sporichthyaceae bacterium]